VDQEDQGDHNPPWWTRSVQDHREPHSNIFLMYLQTRLELKDVYKKGFK